MPPKNKFTQAQIVAAAVELTRQKGFDAVTARDLGAALGTSSKPVYTAFDNMSQLKEAVILAAQKIYLRFCDEETVSGKYPAYKATGMAYIRFAREERNLFRLLFMRDRSGEAVCANDESYDNVIHIVETLTGLDHQDANLFHAEMWIVVHGIATMFATAYMDWDMELVSRMLTDIYNGLSASKQKEDSHEQHH